MRHCVIIKNMMEQSPTIPYKYMPRIKKHELSIQRRVATYLRREYPHVDFHSDYAAGMLLSPNQAIIRRSLESGRGWSDMFIAAPSRDFHGLFLELKREDVSIYVTRGPRKGQLVANEQIQIEADFIRRKRKEGYFACFAVGYDKAVKVIDWYFERPQNATLF